MIPRFLPWRVGQLLAVYLAYVQPFQHFLSVKVKGSGQSDHIWANEFGVWGTDRLTKIIIRESSKWLGTRLTTLDYRHIAVSLGREKVGEQFSRGYAGETAESEEPEVAEDDPLEVSAGRGGEIGGNRYGVSLDVIKHLSSRSIDTFRPLCQKWHTYSSIPPRKATPCRLRARPDHCCALATRRLSFPAKQTVRCIVAHA